MDDGQPSTASRPGEVFWCASDVGWVVGHSYIVYGPLLHGCTTVLYEGKPVGTPDAGAFWRVVAEHKAWHCSPRRPPSGRSRRRIRTASCCGATTSRASAPSSSPASGPTPTRCNGRSESSACRSSIIGGRPKPAGRSPETRSGLERCRSNTARRRCRCPATTCGCWTKAGSRCRPDTMGSHRHQAAAAARLPADALAARRALPRGLSRRLPGLLQRPGCGLHRRRRLRLRHGPHRRHHQRGRPPAVDRAAWKRCWPRHPAVAECAVIGVEDALKGEVPLRLRRAEIRGRSRRPTEIERELVALVRETDRPGGGLQTRDHGQPPAENPLGQDPARHDEEDRRRRDWTMPPRSTIPRCWTRSGRR